MIESNLQYTTTQFYQKSLKFNQYDNFVLGADVGGTRTNIAIAGIKEKNIELLFSLDFNTKDLDSFLPALKHTIAVAKKEYDIHILSGCIGAAGIVSHDHSYVDLTNIPWNIDTKELLKNTPLDTLFILNDFQVLGYGINTVDFNDEAEVTTIRKTKNPISKKTRVVLGAGTGLGKTILRYDSTNHLYHAYESEGGHVDIPSYTDFELELFKFIQQKKHPKYPVTYEDVLSGNGIVDIFTFLRSKQLFEESRYIKEIDRVNEKANQISKYRLADDYCKETFRLFRRFFARCAKNIALDSLAHGGIFIAGGIALKNKEIFLSNEFKLEFNQSFQRLDFLRNIPLFLLSNYYLSLQGACFAAAHASSILKAQNMEKMVKTTYESN